jgi:hypothetical protein
MLQGKSIICPSIEYLKRKNTQTADKWFVSLSAIERNALEDFSELVVHYSRRMHIAPPETPLDEDPPWHPDTFAVEILIPQHESYVPAPGNKLLDALPARFKGIRVHNVMPEYFKDPKVSGDNR